MAPNVNRFCSVKNCFNSTQTTKNISFFSYPKDETRCQEWLRLAGRGDLLGKTAVEVNRCRYYICGAHFESHCFYNVVKRNRLLFSAIPILFPPTPTGSTLKFFQRKFPASNVPALSFSQPNVKQETVENYSPDCYRTLKEDAVPTLCSPNGRSQEHERDIPDQKRLAVDAWTSMSPDLVSIEENFTRGFTATENIMCNKCRQCSCHARQLARRKRPSEILDKTLETENVLTEGSENGGYPQEKLIRLPGENEFVLVQDDVTPLQTILRSPVHAGELQDVQVGREMPESCCAYGCTNRRVKGAPLQFFSFPLNDETRLKQWLEAIRRQNFKPSKHTRICSDHFSQASYEHRPGINVPYLKKTAVPSIFKGFPQHLQKKVCELRLEPECIIKEYEYVVSTELDDIPKQVPPALTSDAVPTPKLPSHPSKKPIKRRRRLPNRRPHPSKKLDATPEPENVSADVSENGASPQKVLRRLPGENEFELHEDDLAPVHKSPLHTAELRETPKSSCKRCRKKLTVSTARHKVANYQLKKLLSDSRREVVNLNKSILQLTTRNTELLKQLEIARRDFEKVS